MKKAIVLSSYEFLKKFNTEFKRLKFLEKNLRKNVINVVIAITTKKFQKETKKTASLD